MWISDHFNPIICRSCIHVIVILRTKCLFSFNFIKKRLNYCLQMNYFQKFLSLSPVWPGPLHGTPRNGKYFLLLLNLWLFFLLNVFLTVLSGLIDHCSDTYSCTYGGIVMLPDEASHWCLLELTKHVPTHWLACALLKLPTLICYCVYGVVGAAGQLWRGGAGAAWAGGRARGSVVPGGRPAGHTGGCRGAAGRGPEGSWTG